MKQLLVLGGFIIVLLLIGVFSTMVIFPMMSSQPMEDAPAEQTISDEVIETEEQTTTTPSQDAVLSTSTAYALPYIQEVEDQTLVSAITELTGEALGTWYFEADFPIDVIDTSSQILETLIATAQSDWMTTSSVAFVAPFDASQYVGQQIAFVLRKDNPTGDPQFDASTTTVFTLIQ